MQTFNIYLAGAMGGLSWQEQTEWRNDISERIGWWCDAYPKNPMFCSPPEYYSFDDPTHRSEREVFEYDLYRVRNSDLIIVNFNDGGKSIGTAMELAIAHELRIPVIGLNADKVDLHPWLVECVTRMCDDIDELIDHVILFYLV